jgi:hypothetical protein
MEGRHSDQAASQRLSSRPSVFGCLGAGRFVHVIVPNVVPDIPPLRQNPVFLYYSDRFTRPQPFRPDIVISIDDVFDKKIDMLGARFAVLRMATLD